MLSALSDKTEESQYILKQSLIKLDTLDLKQNFKMANGNVLHSHGQKA
jgi:hypothetical protein